MRSPGVMSGVVVLGPAVRRQERGWRSWGSSGCRPGWRAGRRRSGCAARASPAGMGRGITSLVPTTWAMGGFPPGQVASSADRLGIPPDWVTPEANRVCPADNGSLHRREGSLRRPMGSPRDRRGASPGGSGYPPPMTRSADEEDHSGDRWDCPNVAGHRLDDRWDRPDGPGKRSGGQGESPRFSAASPSPSPFTGGRKDAKI